jgi:hypothetical protein
MIHIERGSILGTSIIDELSGIPLARLRKRKQGSDKASEPSVWDFTEIARRWISREFR